jgi:hypothetical protein
MVLHIFTEEASFKLMADHVVPKLLPEGAEFHVYPHQGKQDLEKALISTVPFISRMPDSRILITRDKDTADCRHLKNKLLKLIEVKCNCPYLIRIICHELECWYLGDLQAIKAVYPRFSPDKYINSSVFRNVDKIQNAPEKILNIVPELNKREYLPKLEFSRKVSAHLNIDRNKSTSFRHFVSAVRKLTS